MIKALQAAVVEKDVENAYRETIRKGRPQATITSPYNTDGYAQWDSVRLLLEAKYDLDFKARVPVCNTLGQCLLYIKRFEASGEPLPNVILVGDRNECFVLATAAVKGFLALPIDWTVAPSSGSPELTRALVEGMNILPYVYDMDGTFKFKDVLAKVETLAAGEQHAVKATQANIGAIFTYWRDRVFKDPKLTAVEQVDVFLRCLFQPGDVYPHPTKKGVLVVPTYKDGVVINADQYRSFFDHFVQGYKPSEIEKFYASKDRLIEDDARRRQGAFFTPGIWTAEAHKTIEGVLGPNWKDECIVWDPAAGTANLTRDYEFNDLLISTAEKPDVTVIEEQGYNPGADVFQYDFLNPGIWSPFFDDGEQNVLPEAVHQKLKAASKAGKRLVFLMNPPYAEDGVAGAKGKSRKGVASTSAVARELQTLKMGRTSRQLYAQFMYQCARLARDYGFKQHTVALFSMSKFMCSGSFRKFREWWYGRHEVKSGFLFQASHFADVSGRWGISFTVWNGGAGHKTDPKQVVTIDLKDEQDFAVQTTGAKAVYNSDGRDASNWMVGMDQGKITCAAPILTSGLRALAQEQPHQGRWRSGAVAQLANKGNSLMKSSTDVYWLSSKVSQRIGVVVAPDNWRRAIALYGARKLVKDHWTIHEDEYLAPHDEGTPAYEQWVNDCHVYALLDTTNNCTAMRDVAYKDGPPNGSKTWTIHNHFFWHSHADALRALDTVETPTLYKDCKANPSKDVFGNSVESTPDPYMAHVLDGMTLSPDAQHVLDLLDALWTASLPHRESYAAGKPELHLTAWDASTYQLKHLWRDLFPAEWAELQEARNLLAGRLKAGVYDYGFLKR